MAGDARAARCNKLLTRGLKRSAQLCTLRRNLGCHLGVRSCSFALADVNSSARLALVQQLLVVCQTRNGCIEALCGCVSSVIEAVNLQLRMALAILVQQWQKR